MKNRVLYPVLLGLLVLALAAPALAQVDRLRADIPFNFVAGERGLPSGNYVIGELRQHVVVLRGTAGGTFLMTLPAEEDRHSTMQPRLVFHQYGDEYFLAEIWRGETIGYKVPQNERERKLAQKMKTSEVAVLLTPATAAGN